MNKDYIDFQSESVCSHKFIVGDKIRLKNQERPVKRRVIGINKNGYMLPSFPTLEHNDIGIDYVPFSEEDLWEKVNETN